MLFQTPTQFVVLLLLLVVGWLFGLASHPGGRKWRSAYDDERLSHAGYRDDAEEQLKAGDRRIADLESENARLRADLDKARGPVACRRRGSRRDRRRRTRTEARLVQLARGWR